MTSAARTESAPPTNVAATNDTTAKIFFTRSSPKPRRLLDIEPIERGPDRPGGACCKILPNFLAAGKKEMACFVVRSTTLALRRGVGWRINRLAPAPAARRATARRA